MSADHTPLPTTSIGSLNVSRIGLGCMGMTMAYGRRAPQSGIETIQHAIDRGVNLFDTADMYANGSNEELVGRALAGRRRDVILATKCGFLTWPVVGLPRGLNGHPDHIRRAVQASLKRLGTDYVDLYYLHRADPKVPIEESVGAMSELVASGLVREVGLSEVSGEQLRKAHAVHPIAALQTEWSIVSRELEADAVPVARELGTSIVPYSPLGRGMLTADPAALNPGLLDFRRFLPRWSRANIQHNTQLAATVQEIGRAHDASAAQVALAWVLARGEDVVPIPGTSKAPRIDENLGALDVSLTPDDLAALDGLRAAGDRYGPRGA